MMPKSGKDYRTKGSLKKNSNANTNYKLADLSPGVWVIENGIKTEKGDPLEFRDHPFLWEILNDLSPLQAIRKPAQIGASTIFSIKPFWMGAKLGMDIVYTLPTDSDVNDFVGGKTNRIIAQNPILQAFTKDRDTIEQKQVGKNLIYYRGTWVKKAAMMVPCDCLIHDEVDASKQDVIEDYETRIKHSKFKWRWYFSHPTTEGAGVDKYWVMSDQKYWFITCPKCAFKQYLDWPDSIDMERKIYVCKDCGQELSNDDRRKGEWVRKYDRNEERPFSGYWISSLMCPWIPASEIIDNFNRKDPEYFSTKVLGKPYVGLGNKLTREALFKNLKRETNPQDGRIIIGVDTGAKIHLVCGNERGLFYWNESSSYEELERLMSRFPKAIVVIDQGGDLIHPRELREKYPGRVFLCYFRQDRKTFQLLKWGEGNEYGVVVADRNRMFQMVVDEFNDKRIPIWGNEGDWHDYSIHWSNVYRTKEETSLGTYKYEWKRSGPDHLVLATIYWRIGMAKYGQGDAYIMGDDDRFKGIPKSYEVSPSNKVPLIYPEKNFQQDYDDD